MVNVFTVLLDIVESDWATFRTLEEVRQHDSETRTNLFTTDTALIVHALFECNVNIISDRQNGIAETAMLHIAMLEHQILKQRNWKATVSYTIHGRRLKYIKLKIIVEFSTVTCA